MKKLNKKGVTLIELIVSFAIVSVALIYFYQTIVDLHRMYKNSNKATDEFVNKDYALRVLDAYIKKKDVSSLGNVCENYLLGYCSEAKVTKNGVFSKVELKDSHSTILATSYYYTEDKIVAAIESTALDSNGNVKSLTDLQKAVERQVGDKEKSKYSYEQSIEDGKVKYEVTYTDSSKTTIYTKEDNKTIDTKLKDELNDESITETNANNFLASINSNWIVSNANVYHDEKENKYYATYDVIKKDNKESVAKNVIKISELDKLTSIMDKNSIEQIEREYSYNGVGLNFIKIDKDGLYNLKYLVSVTSGKNCQIMFNDGSNIIGADFNKDNASSASSNIHSKKINDKLYIYFDKVNLKDIVYKSTSGTACTMKLVEAYKYK